MNNDTNEIVIGTNGVAEARLTAITGQTVTGYGVLSGTRNVDWEYKNDSPNAIGHNITVIQDSTCAENQQLTFGGEGLTFNGEDLTT